MLANLCITVSRTIRALVPAVPVVLLLSIWQTRVAWTTSNCRCYLHLIRTNWTNR